MIDQVGALREIFQAVGVVAWGTFDTSSATVPADSSRTEADDQFKDMFLMPLAGTYQGVCKRITDYTGIGGIFQIDVGDPFPGVTGLVSYLVINRYVPPILGGNTVATLFNTNLVAADRDGDIVHRLEWLMSGSGGADVGANYNIEIAHGVAEQDMVEISKAIRWGLSIYIDLNALVAAGEGGTVTMRLYNKIDETNYRIVATAAFTVGVTEIHPSFEVIRVNHDCKVTIQLSAAVTAQRTINYRYITEDLE